MRPSGELLLREEDLRSLKDALENLEKGFGHLPKLFSERTTELDRVLADTAERLKDNYPYFHPLYAGQMLKPPHPIARLVYALALWINPNNHALDGGRASSIMEKEAIAELAAMFGWKAHLGHLCGGGTMANLEALWISGQIHPDKKIAASQQAHFTHQRISQVLKLPFEGVTCDHRGRLDLTALERKLAQGDIGTVVATIGTTATGSVDPLPELMTLRKQYGFRLHADAAYGGYFLLADHLQDETLRSFERLNEVDSIVIDPHKHGLQPYGCGCVLFRDPEVGKFYKHDSAYTYFTSTDLHLGEISLECSRPGAAAAALWATQKLLPLIKDGEFAQRLSRSRQAALALYHRLKNDPRWLTAFEPELDIVIWLPRARSVSESSKLARRVFDAAAKQNLHLALASLPVDFFPNNDPAMQRDKDTATCLRSVLMKPEHADWVDEIWRVLSNLCVD